MRIPRIELDWQLRDERIIPAERLETQYQRAAAMRGASHDASSIVNAARRKAVGIIREANKICRQLDADKRHELEMLRRETLSSCEDQWLQTHVTWLLRDEALERTLVKAVSSRIHLSMEQVLTAWFEQQPHDKTLCARLAIQAEQMAAEGALTLHIHPSMQERMRTEFGSRFTLVLEPDFSEDRAVLASPQFSVALSLSNHFQQLLTWLRANGSETGEQDESIGHHAGGES